MSRGYGRVQRSILEWLATEPAGCNKRRGLPNRNTIADAAKHVYETSEPTDAQLVATRRAIRGLAADRAVDVAFGAENPEKGRRLPRSTRVRECGGDGCEWCETGVPRYTGTW